ncbi:MAG TPA: hypothetical protein VN840_11540, partial [Streptosporangiaceae bacterium]|nr:hypothetical protein [Streptosporangiaceae bacterium]
RPRFRAARSLAVAARASTGRSARPRFRAARSLAVAARTSTGLLAEPRFRSARSLASVGRADPGRPARSRYRPGAPRPGSVSRWPGSERSTFAWPSQGGAVSGRFGRVRKAPRFARSAPRHPAARQRPGRTARQRRGRTARLRAGHRAVLALPGSWQAGRRATVWRIGSRRMGSYR